MSHLYGYVVEDISMFKLSVSSVGKVLTFSIDSDSSDGLDHSIYSVQILWDDGGFTKADVNKPSYTLTHSFAEYGKHNFNVFLVSSYQNAYGYSLSWNLTETSPSSLSMSSSSSSTPSSSPSSTSTASAASIGSKSTTPYSSSFSSDDVSSSTSGNDAYINIGWVAFILAAVLIVVIAGMLIALKVLTPKYDKDQLYGRL